MALIIYPLQPQFGHTANSCCRFCSVKHHKIIHTSKKKKKKKPLPGSRFRLSNVQGFACKIFTTVNHEDTNTMIHQMQQMHLFTQTTEKTQIFIPKTVIQQLLKIKTLQKYPGISCVGVICLILNEVFIYLDFKGMPSTFNSLVER